MRIPSQFNDSSLYRPERGRDDRQSNRRRHVPAGSSGEWRRIIRLGVALLFVVVMMREAARPGIYQPFFEQSGSAGEQWRAVAMQNTAPEFLKPPSQTSLTARASQPSPVSTVPQQPFDPSVWVDKLDTEQQRAWAAAIVQWSRGRALSDETSDTTRLSTQVIANSIHLLEELQREEDAEVIASLTDLDPDSNPNWDTIRWWAAPLLRALDAAALERVSDGTFWTGEDADAFYLQLASADKLEATDTETVGTLPLLHEPNVYQGKRIRLVGRVGVCELKEAKPNAFGIKQYWRTWMVPEDGGVRPIALITTEMPDALSEHLVDGEWNAKNAFSNPKGEFVAVGRFLKRLPYRSSVGSDLAPVVVGRIVATRDTTAKVTAKPSDPVAKGAAVSWKTAGLFAAVLGGVGIAFLLMSRAAADAKRSRELRQRAWSETEIQIEGYNENDARNEEMR
ncbi:MAG: hypothetical protein AAFX06_26565 [Planctomycetota bacterium]